MALQARRSRSAVASSTPITESDHTLISIFDAARNMIDLPRRSAAARGGLRYRDFLDALGVAVYTTDADGRITFFNEAAATLWGRRPELGEEWCGSLRLFSSDGAPMRHDECPMAIALQREPAGPRLRGRSPSGPTAAGSSFVPYPTPLRDADGTLIGAVNVLVDVTERRARRGGAPGDAPRRCAPRTRSRTSSSASSRTSCGRRSRRSSATPSSCATGATRSAEPTERSMVADIAEDSERLLGDHREPAAAHPPRVRRRSRTSSRRSSTTSSAGRSTRSAGATRSARSRSAASPRQRHRRGRPDVPRAAAREPPRATPTSTARRTRRSRSWSERDGRRGAGPGPRPRHRRSPTDDAERAVRAVLPDREARRTRERDRRRAGRLQAGRRRPRRPDLGRAARRRRRRSSGSRCRFGPRASSPPDSRLTPGGRATVPRGPVAQR